MAHKYSLANSLSPMMFRKKNKESKERKERSRSLDDILAADFDEKVKRKSSKGKCEEGVWEEVASVSAVAPTVMCILPPLSMDFVCSAVLAVGATPLLTDDPMDVEKDLRNSRVVVVDVSAPQTIIEQFIQIFSALDDHSMVLVATQVGSNDRKRDLAMRVIDECGPILITGRLGDIYALGQVVSERGSGGSDSEGDASPTSCQVQVGKSCDLRKASEPHNFPPAMRRAAWRHPEKEAASLGTIPAVSPGTSPRHSPRASPRASPRGSPSPSPRHIASSPRGAGKRLSIASSIAPPVPFRHSSYTHAVGGGRKIGRAPTLLPRVNMKGQFQDNSMLEVNVDDALHYGQTLSAYTRATIHLYETNVVTNGETVVEIMNPQLGMKDLHSLLPSSAAIAAACVSSVAAEADEVEGVTLRQFSHALALWYVAAEEACNHANQKGRILPGTLRQSLIDALHYLDEPHVRTKAHLKAHTVGKEC